MSYIDVWSILEEANIDVDWIPIFEDQYSSELGSMDICVISVFLFLL